MKRNLLTRLTMVLLTLGLTGGFARAQEDNPPGGGGKKPQTPPARRANQAENLISRLKKAINPTPKQLPRLEQIWKTYRQSARNWRRENGTKLQAAQKKLSDAKKSGDKNAINAATKETKAIQTSRRNLTKNIEKQLSGVLTKEQMEKAKIVLRGRPGNRIAMLEQLNLTETQKVKIKIILDEATAQGKKTDNKGVKKELLDEAFEKIRQMVLTPEQNGKIASMLRRMRPPGGRAGQRPQPRAELNLTDEQKAKEKKIMDQAREAAAKTEDRRARRRIITTGRRTVRQEVWTDEQRTQARQSRTQRGRGGRARMEQMGLSNDQITQAEKIMSEAREKADEAGSRQERRQIMRDAFRKMREEVWTDEQRTQIRERMAQRGRERMQQMGLNDDQITQTEKIMSEARQQARDAGSREDRRQIMRDAFRKMREEVWTDEQRERFEQRRNQWRERGGQGGRRGRGGGGGGRGGDGGGG